MFTGIIEKTVSVVGVAVGPRFRRLTISSIWDDVRHGESIAVNGCCLTVADLAPGELSFDVIAQTLDTTNMAALLPGDRVNVERSVRVGDRVDGHFVQGHIDGVAKLIEVQTEAGEWRLTIETPAELAKYLVPKGSIAIDGVSLTIAAIDGRRFQVALIPTTVELTTLGDKKPGWLFNFEADMFAKTIVTFLERKEAV